MGCSDVEHVSANQHDGSAFQIPPAPDSDDPTPVDEIIGTINGPPRDWTKAHGPTEGCTAAMLHLVKERNTVHPVERTFFTG